MDSFNKENSDNMVDITQQNEEVNITTTNADSITTEPAPVVTETVAATEPATTVTETAEPTPAPTKKDSDLPRRIKIGVIVAGGIFIVGAIAYAAAFFGGNTNEIPTEIEVEEVVAEAEVEPTPTVGVTPKAVEEEVEEEDPTSPLTMVNGNAKYDSCVYADGGVIIVKKGELYGATNYLGQEIAPCNFENVDVFPTEKGYFVVSTSKKESVSKENEGTTIVEEQTITNYTLYNNEGKKIYEGNNAVYPTEEMYVLNVKDEAEPRNNRNEYYKMADNKAPFYTLYTNGEFNKCVFKNGLMAVYGFEKPTTEEDDIKPDAVKFGLMDTTGKVTFLTAPGLAQYKEARALWEADEKNQEKMNPTPTPSPVVEEATEETEQEEAEVLYDEDGNPIEVTPEAGEETSEEITPEVTPEITPDITPEADELFAMDEEGAPKYIMGRIYNSPNNGYFIYEDKYNNKDVMSVYTDKGQWYADLDLNVLSPDAAKGFVVGTGNGNSIDGYLTNGYVYYNYGPEMIVNVGGKSLLVDISKSKGMQSATTNDKIVVGVYDTAVLGESNYIVTFKDNKYTYVDHTGKATDHVYEEATAFVGGYGVVVEKGIASVISDTFEPIQEIGESNSTSICGDLYIKVTDAKNKCYMLRERKDAPLSDLEAADDTADKADKANAKDSKADKANAKDSKADKANAKDDKADKANAKDNKADSTKSNKAK